MDALINVDFENEVIDQPRYVYDERGKNYWLKPAGGSRWVAVPEKSLRRHLKGLGKRVKAEGLETLSEVDAIIENSELNDRVNYAGPLAGHWSGFKPMCGESVLVTRDPELVEPKAPSEDMPLMEGYEDFENCRGWPVLGRVIKNMLSSTEDDIDQRAWYFGYVRHVLDCLYEDTFDKIIALGVAGEVSSGKSLLFVEIHRELFGKREAKPYEWMIGQENFNGDLLESVLWTVDDEISSTRMDARLKMAGMLKKIVANSSIRIRGMRQEGMALKPLRAPVVLVNLEPGNLMVLPPLEEDTLDKIALLKAYYAKMPMPVGSVSERRVFMDTMKAELPYFVWWLRNEWKTPDELQGRFGMQYYHHPEIVDSLTELSSEMVIWRYLVQCIFNTGFGEEHPQTKKDLGAGSWVGSAEELFELLTRPVSSDDPRPVLNPVEVKNVPKSGYLAQRLRKLERLHPECVEYYRTSKGRFWILKSPKEEEEM